MPRHDHHRRNRAVAASLLLGLTRCTTAPMLPTPAAITTPPATAPARPLPQKVSLDENGKPILLNDPSAPANSPLCARQAQEANAIGTALQGDSLGGVGLCASFACYDRLTATYIGADGDRHVCR